MTSKRLRRLSFNQLGTSLSFNQPTSPMASPPPKKPRLSPSPTTTTPAISTLNGGTSISQSNAEAAVGITEYVNVNPTLPAWSGVLKQRYTDFLVNEVDERGVVVHLKSTRAPTAPERPQSEPKKDTRVNAVKPSTEAPAVVVAEVAPLLPFLSSVTTSLTVWRKDSSRAAHRVRPYRHCCSDYRALQDCRGEHRLPHHASNCQ